MWAKRTRRTAERAGVVGRVALGLSGGEVDADGDDAGLDDEAREVEAFEVGEGRELEREAAVGALDGVEPELVGRDAPRAR